MECHRCQCSFREDTNSFGILWCNMAPTRSLKLQCIQQNSGLTQPPI
uniref:Uncharacterized protein n=1 Tax=Anguilla anguilla TaxID=7936 RepID=A0A0E9TQ09_ANGAN